MKIGNNLSGYYKIHSRIYDLTRWSFLFGREDMINTLEDKQYQHILEVGCGTGFSLLKLWNRFPQTRNIQGLDASEDMLNKARKKIEKLGIQNIDLENGFFNTTYNKGKYDLILFSYSLSMFGDDYKEAILTAKNLLEKGGTIAVVDFHHSRFKWFTNWMRLNHVKMEGHLLPCLTDAFNPIEVQVKTAYFGLWKYFQFIGEKQ